MFITLYKVGEKTMYTSMCNWVPMLHYGKKNCVGEITIKKLSKFYEYIICWSLYVIQYAHHQNFLSKNRQNFIVGIDKLILIF